MIAAGSLYAFDSVAIVGASPRNAYGSWVLAGLRTTGFTGTVVCINPNAEMVEGYPAYASLADVPHRIGAVVVVVRAERVAAILEECGRLGIRSVSIITAGFAETGAPGRALQDELAAIAARYGIAVVGPNCMGFVSLHDRTSTYGSANLPTGAGEVAVISQSGGTLNEVMSYGAYRGLHFSKLVSSGNEAVLSLADYLEDLLDDPHTTTIGVIAEGLQAPERLGRAFARAAQLRKPIVAIKLGTSELAIASALTHTGSTAGSPEFFAALCAQYGVTLVEDLDELCETLLAFSRTRALIERSGPPRGFAAIEISGGGKGLICDLAERAGLTFPPLSDAAAARITALLGDASPATNPLDITGSWEGPQSLERHETALTALADDARCDVVVSRITVSPKSPLHGALDHGRLINRMRAAHPAIFFAALGRASDAINPEWQAFCAETGLTYLQGYKRGIAALGRLDRYRRFLAAARQGDEASIADTAK